MDIAHEGEITGAAVKALRERGRIGQGEFWGAYGISQPGAWRYENGRAPIPLLVRRLIFINHVAGLKLDASTTEGAAEIRRIAQLVAAGEHVKQAKRLLSEIEQ